MSTVNSFHHKSMEFAALALMQRARGNAEDSVSLFEQALENELAAIRELEKLDTAAEPTYSVLHRSAGTLALDCNKFRLAEKLVAKALAQEPPTDIAGELRDLLEEVYFQKHLDTQGVVLNEGEVQMSLAGRGVGSGRTRLSDFTNRVNMFSTLIYRIAERGSKLPFRKRGSPSASIQNSFRTFASAPRVGSFAVSLKLGNPTDQLSFPGMLDSHNVINEFMDLMELANASRVSELRDRIPDSSYMNNFLASAKKIAPDGDRIRQVAFTAIGGSGTRALSVTTPSSLFPTPRSTEQVATETEVIEVDGTLLYADAIRGGGDQIRIVNENGTQYTIDVAEGLMNDIVSPMWDSTVRIQGVRRGAHIILQDIWQIE